MNPNLLNYNKCLGFATVSLEKCSHYIDFNWDNLKQLKKHKGNIHYFRLPLSRGENFSLNLLFEMRCQNKHFQLIDFIPCAYITKGTPIVCNPEWMKKSFWDGMMRISYKNVGLSFHMGVPTIALMPKINFKKQYYCSAACYAQQIQMFASADEFKANNPIYEVESVAYPPAFVKNRYRNGIIINGYLRHVEEAINPITEETFYYLIVESMGHRFHVFAASSDFEDVPEEGKIVSVFGLMNGFLGAEAEGELQRFTCTSPMEQPMFNFAVRHMLSNPIRLL